MDSAPWAAAGGFNVYLWGLKMEVGSTWVNLGCDMALVDGRMHFGEV